MKKNIKRRGKKIISAVGDYENELEARSFINLDSLANELVLALEDTGNSVDTNGGAGDEALFEAPYKAYCFVAKKTEDGSKSQVLYLNKNSFDSVPHDIGGVNLTRDEYASLFRKLEEAFDNLKVSPVLNAEDKYVQFI